MHSVGWFEDFLELNERLRWVWFEWRLNPQEEGNIPEEDGVVDEALCLISTNEGAGSEARRNLRLVRWDIFIYRVIYGIIEEISRNERNDKQSVRKNCIEWYKFCSLKTCCIITRPTPANHASFTSIITQPTQLYSIILIYILLYIYINIYYYSLLLSIIVVSNNYTISSVIILIKYIPV